MIGVKAVQQELASRRLASLAATAFNLPMLESTELYLYWAGKKEILSPKIFLLDGTSGNVLNKT